MLLTVVPQGCLPYPAKNWAANAADESRNVSRQSNKIYFFIETPFIK
jgi:hypothetical protein